MQNITIRSHVGDNGILQLEVPVDMTNVDSEITIAIKPVTPTEPDNKLKGKGWPAGFFEETFGCFKDNPLVIDSEGIYEEKEESESGICWTFTTLASRVSNIASM